MSENLPAKPGPSSESRSQAFDVPSVEQPYPLLLRGLDSLIVETRDPYERRQALEDRQIALNQLEYQEQQRHNRLMELRRYHFVTWFSIGVFATGTVMIVLGSLSLGLSSATLVPIGTLFAGAGLVLLARDYVFRFFPRLTGWQRPFGPDISSDLDLPNRGGNDG